MSLEPHEQAVEVEALMAQGLQAQDPAWAHHVRTLARRSALLQGEARRFVQGRLAQALVQGRVRMASLAALPAPQGTQESAQAGAEAVAAVQRAPQPSSLSELLAALQALQASQDGAGPAVAPLDAGAASGAEMDGMPPLAELRALRAHKSTWLRLRDEQRLAQALSAVPPNAGPLHTQRLVLRALQRMRETSPGCFHRWLSHLETLQWLEHLAAPTPDPRRPATAASPSSRGTSRRRPGPAGK